MLSSHFLFFRSVFIALFIAFCFFITPSFARASDAHFSLVPTSNVQNTRVIGGTAVSSTIPWIVSIRQKGNIQSHFCGGTLIASRWVLTAAHCFQDQEQNAALEVVMGNLSRLSTNISNVITVKRIILHPKFNAISTENDIALVELVKEVTNQPVLLSDTNQLSKIAFGSAVRVMGWGYTTADISKSVLPTNLMSVDVNYLDMAACESGYKGIPWVTLFDTQICAGIISGGKDGCVGDSGGPLLSFQNNQWIQVGVVSWGIGCAQPLYYGIYTKVSDFYVWINEVTNGLSISGHITPDLQSVLGYISEGKSVKREIILRNNSVVLEAYLGDFYIEGSLAGNANAPVQNFSIDSKCPQMLAPQKACSFDIIFNSAPSGLYAAEVSIDSSLNSIFFPQYVGVMSFMPELSNGLGLAQQQWYGLSPAWEIDSLREVNGKLTLVSGKFQGAGQSLLTTYIKGPSFFEYVVSVRGNANDELRVLVDDKLFKSYTGENNSVQTSARERVTLPAGEHQVSLFFVRSSEGVSDSAAWLDSFSINSSISSSLNINTPTVDKPAGAAGELAVGAGGGAMPVSYLIGMILLSVIRLVKKKRGYFLMGLGFSAVCSCAIAEKQSPLLPKPIAQPIHHIETLYGFNIQPNNKLVIDIKTNGCTFSNHFTLENVQGNQYQIIRIKQDYCRKRTLIKKIELIPDSHFLQNDSIQILNPISARFFEVGNSTSH